MKRILITVVTVLAIVLVIIVSADVFPLKSQAPIADDPNNEQQHLLPSANTQEPVSDSDEPMPDSTEPMAFEIVKMMKAGWNLGNALDSLDHQKRGINSTLKTMTAEQYYETYWGNPVTTPKVIADIAEMGFGAVRIPVTWQDHMDDNYVISRSWLERVKEVVDYTLDNDMYCIINLHHDTGHGSWPWLKADPENVDEIKTKFSTVWKQIAEFFSDYDEKLLFESFNEILDASDRWTDSTPDSYDVVNQLNQLFVDTVRATGGRNTQRFLIVTPYAAGGSSEILYYFRLPTDTISGYLIVSIHTYEPAAFTWHESMATWTETYSGWDENSASGIDATVKSLRDNLIDKGIPLIITECGAWNKNNTADRCAYAAHLARAAAANRITCFWWDEGGGAETPESVSGSALYDRYNEKWLFPDIAEAFTKAAAGAWTAW